MPLQKQIESLLFIAGRPLTYKKLHDIIGHDVKIADIKHALTELAKHYKKQDCGIQIVSTDDKAQMVTNKDNSDLVEKFSKEEMQGELSKPSIETLTIIAYRGPVSKLELERIRGINCSLILRNLMLRGLITERKDAKRHDTYYNVSLEFLKYLGVACAQDLPDYDKLHKNEDIDKFLSGQSS